MNNRQEILTQSIWKLMFKMSLPGILGMLVLSANAFIDAIFVGRLVGPEALAGISLTIPLFVLNSAFISLVSAGSASLLSRALGGSDNHVQPQLLFQVFILCIAGSLLLSVIGYFHATSLLRLMGAKGESLVAGVAYYKISMLGSFFSIFGLCLSALIRAEGNMKYAMSVTAAGVVINIFFNPIFIKYLNLGVAGSAWATVLSMVFYTLFNAVYFFRKKIFDKKIIRYFALDIALITEICGIGLSAMIMQLSSLVRQVFLFRSVSFYSNSEHEIALFATIYRIFSFSIIPVFGMLQALQPIAGMNYGADQTKRSIIAMQIFRKAAIIMMVFITLPSFVYPEQILSLILPDADFSERDLLHFRLMLCILPVAPVASTAIVYLQATGNKKVATKLAFSRELFLFLPIIFIIPYYYKYYGIYYSLFIENVLYMMLVSAVMFRTLKPIARTF